MTLKLKTGGIISQLFCLLVVLDFFLKNIMIVFIGYSDIYIYRIFLMGLVNKKIEYRAQIVHLIRVTS